MGSKGRGDREEGQVVTVGRVGVTGEDKKEGVQREVMSDERR